MPGTRASRARPSPPRSGDDAPPAGAPPLSAAAPRRPSEPLIDDDERSRHKSRKTLPRASTISEDWGIGSLAALPVLMGKAGSGVIDAFLRGKDFELRSASATIAHPDGSRSRLADLATNSHLVFSEYTASSRIYRRLVLRVHGNHRPFRTHGQAVAGLKERVLPYALCEHFAEQSGHMLYSEAFGNAFYTSTFGCTTGGSVIATPVTAVGWLPDTLYSPDRPMPRASALQPTSRATEAPLPRLPPTQPTPPSGGLSLVDRLHAAAGERASRSRAVPNGDVAVPNAAASSQRRREERAREQSVRRTQAADAARSAVGAAALPPEASGPLVDAAAAAAAAHATTTDAAATDATDGATAAAAGAAAAGAAAGATASVDAAASTTGAAAAAAHTTATAATAGAADAVADGDVAAVEASMDEVLAASEGDGAAHAPWHRHVCQDGCCVPVCEPATDDGGGPDGAANANAADANGAAAVDGDARAADNANASAAAALLAAGVGQAVPQTLASGWCTICNCSLQTATALGAHIRSQHVGASPAELASMGFAVCPADGCGVAYCLVHASGYAKSSWYQHQQQYKNKDTWGAASRASHESLEQSHNGMANAYRTAARQARSDAPAGSEGARLITVPPPRGGGDAGSAARGAAVTGSQGATAAPHSGGKPSRAHAAAMRAAAASATPAADYDVMALLDFDMDRIKRASLHAHALPRSAAKRTAVAQPLVFARNATGEVLQGTAVTAAALATGWMGAPLTAAATNRGVAADKMFYLAHAAIFLRPLGSAASSPDEMVARAVRVASSASALLAAVEELLAAADTETGLVPSGESPTGGTDTAVDHGPSPHRAPSRQSVHRRARFAARCGERRKGWMALKPCIVADGESDEARRMFASLTPQTGAAEVSEELLADHPGVAAFQVTEKMFDAVMSSAPALRAAGTLHDTFEIHQLVWAEGGRAGMLRYFNAWLAGRVHPDIISLLADLRAVLFWKDEEHTAMRPIGIGEAMRRLICRCIARQDKASWVEFFTHMLPEDADARSAAIADAEEALSSLDAAVDGGVDAGLSDLTDVHRSAVADAKAALAAAQAVPNFPTNHCFSPNGTELVNFTVQSWIEAAPDDPVGSDDKENMYNLSSRVAMFEALHERDEFQAYIPIYRAFYGRAARIFLVRSQGEFTLLEIQPQSAADEEMGDGARDVDGETIDVADAADDDELLRRVVHCIRSRRGTHQGCVLATLGAVLPLHLTQHRTQKDYKDMRMIADADDTYVGGPRANNYIYNAYDALRARSADECDHKSNLSKVKFLNPRGGVDGIPPWILAAQGGEIVGFKCVGGFVGPSNAASAAWRASELAAALSKRLQPLAEVDAMVDTETETDVRQLRYNFIRINAGKMPIYWRRIMPPSIAKPVMAATVDSRLRQSFELVADAAGQPAALRERAWQQAQLPTSIGGVDVGGHADLCDASYSAAVLACWPRLLAASSLLTEQHMHTAAAEAARQTAAAAAAEGAASDAPPPPPPPAGGTPALPMLVEFCKAYERCRADRDAVAAEYDEYAKHPYHCVTGSKDVLEGYFRPNKLPRARSLPPVDHVFNSQTKIPIPAQRVLCMVAHHRRWLACRRAAQQIDLTEPHLTCRHREEVRVVAASQATAGSWLDLVPDGSFQMKVDSITFVIMLQRRLGLRISAAAAVHDQQAAAGLRVDRLGDALANAGEYNNRHNGTLRAVQTMVMASAVGPCVLGDKDDVAKTAMLNEDHAVDLAELGGDELTGGDMLYEIKVPSPTIASYSAGNGSASKGGAHASVGHLYGFGSTEERYHLMIYGARERGRQQDGPLKHDTGRGWVRGVRGHYHDAIVRKRTRVCAMIVEAYGGIGRRGRRQCAALAERAKGKSATDRTRYGTTRASTRSHYVHHTQQIAKAAVMYDAQAIRKQILCERQRMLTSHTPYHPPDSGAAHAAAGEQA
jgi:hypothetical protein